MKYCKQCGKEMTDGLRKCPNCGAASDNQSFSKWQTGLLACDVVAVLTLFFSWLKISVFGMSETISPVQLMGYLRDASGMIAYYFEGYSDDVNLILLGGVCLFAAYAASVVLTLMKKKQAFLAGLIANLVMFFFSWEIISIGKELAKYTYDAVTVSGIAYFMFVFSAAASVMCGYVLTNHLESTGSKA